MFSNHEKVCENCSWFKVVDGVPICCHYDYPVLRDSTCEDFEPIHENYRKSNLAWWNEVPLLQPLPHFRESCSEEKRVVEVEKIKT